MPGLGLGLSSLQVQLLAGHLAYLERWNAKLNLVAAASPEMWARRHSLDSLAVAGWVPAGGDVVDVGSGAGFPGIPLAILGIAKRVVLLEPRQNRAAFLQNVVAGLGLNRVEVRCRRAEAEAERFDLVVGRAVAKPDAWASLASRICNSAGRFAFFSQSEPAPELGTGLMLEVRRYLLPSEPERWVGLYVPRGTEGTKP